MRPLMEPFYLLIPDMKNVLEINAINNPRLKSKKAAMVISPLIK